MANVILYIFNDTHEPFGIFTSQDEAYKALENAAKDINTSIENLKADLYLYELPLNKAAAEYLYHPNNK